MFKIIYNDERINVEFFTASFDFPNYFLVFAFLLFKVRFWLFISF